MTKFNKELLQVDEIKDQVILTTFQARLLLGDFFFLITKSPPKTVAKLLLKAQKYMNAEDVMLAKEMKGKRKRDEGTSSNHDKKKETQSVGHTTGKKKELPDRKPKFTNFRKPISTPAERKDRNKYCRFHQDHGHRTDKCRNLKDQVETLIWQGKL